MKQVVNRVLGRGTGRVESTGATHVFCLGIGFGVHRPFLDGVRGSSKGNVCVVLVGPASGMQLKPALQSSMNKALPSFCKMDAVVIYVSGLAPPLFVDGPRCSVDSGSKFPHTNAGIVQRCGGVAQYVVDGEDVAQKAGYLKKCALSTGALLRCASHTSTSMLYKARLSEGGQSYA